MCGIAGYVGLGNEAGNRFLHSSIEQLRHRGPDGNGSWQGKNEPVGLSHVRLSIIDLTAAAAQPMRADSGCVITYNGEVYNYIELREEIGAHLFYTTSDTEVVLRAYEKWGEACVDRLRGMFAFSIWDPSKRKLFIARDRFGIKPFYYAVVGGVFMFASEAKALLPFLKRVETDLDGLHDYFSFQFCLGDKTMFKGVRQLGPAHCGWVGNNGRIVLRRYWEVQYDID